MQVDLDPAVAGKADDPPAVRLGHGDQRSRGTRTCSRGTRCLPGDWLLPAVLAQPAVPSSANITMTSAYRRAEATALIPLQTSTLVNWFRKDPRLLLRPDAARPNPSRPRW